ncbi:MAG: hypothetical protein M3423_06540, partial [Actinomycetota bacterium]|nr:hypothetical protein [Actinomycetota bacterium]
MAMWVVILPVVGAMVALFTGHRQERAAPLAGVVATAAALFTALLIGLSQWGDAPASEFGPYEISTGGTPILASLRVDELSA